MTSICDCFGFLFFSYLKLKKEEEDVNNRDTDGHFGMRSLPETPVPSPITKREKLLEAKSLEVANKRSRQMEAAGFVDE